MPLAPVIASQLTPQARDVSLYIGGRDCTGIAVLTSVSVQNTVGNVPATAEVTIRGALVDLPEIYDQALFLLVNEVTDATIFRGYVVSRHPSSGLEPVVEIRAIDASGLLDDAFIPFESRPAETMQARIGFLWGAFAGSQLSGDLSFVQAIGGTLAAQDFAGLTLRQAIESVIAQASATAEYHVDTSSRLHVYTSETNPAPYNVVVGTPGAGEFAPEDLDINFDSRGYYNRVYVQAATPEASGFYKDDAAIAAANGVVRTAVLLAPDCETLAMSAAVANLFLTHQKEAVPRGTFTASSTYDGWQAGQTLTVTEPDIGLSAESFQIRSALTTFEATKTGIRSKYRIEFGGTAPGPAGAGQQEFLGSGQLVSGNLGGQSNTYVTSEGVSVTDGTTVRAIIGKLPNGSYGVRIVSSTGAVLIDGEQITLTGSAGTISGSQVSGGTIPSGVALGIAQTTITASGVKVNDGTFDRVILGDI